MFAIGNGTASRESEIFVADVIKEVKEKYGKEVHYAIVSEVFFHFHLYILLYYLLLFY